MLSGRPGDENKNVYLDFNSIEIGITWQKNV